MFYPNRIKIVTNYKTLFSKHDFFLDNFFNSLTNRKKPELKPEFVIFGSGSGRQFNLDSSAPTPHVKTSYLQG
jgi:hypothetical protein